MSPQWITAGIALVQLAGLALMWRMQRDQARLLAEVKEWVHREYLPRELAEALYPQRSEIPGISAVSQPIRANS